MAFPTPPPLRDKPPAPILPADLKPKRPDRAMQIIGISIAFWVVLLSSIVSIVLFLLRSWIATFSMPRLFVAVVLIVTVWLGLAIGWRLGVLIIFNAMHSKDPV